MAVRLPAARQGLARLVPLCVVVALLAGCGGANSPPNPASSGAGEMRVTGAPATIQLFQFQPSPLDVATGTTVTWTNGDDIEHTVTAGTPEHRAGTFDSQVFGKGRTYRFTFAEPGDYPYFCARHESMRGEVRVR